LNKMWTSKLAYLRDAFCHLNELNAVDLCKSFVQILLHCGTRQTFSHRSWHFGIALYRKEIQRCFRLWAIYWQVLMLLPKSYY